MMAQDKKFSVIIPLYKDNYKTLGQSLFYLHEQDYSNFEVIFSYNSPTLSTTMVEVRKILKKEKWLVAYKEVDAGYDKKLKAGNHCRAFNKGAEVATGDYLLFLDPDICILPGILREYKDAFDAHPDVSFVYGDYDFEGNVGRVKGRRYSEYELRCANYVSGAFPIKKSAFKGWDSSVLSLQDWDMWYSAIDAGAKGFYLSRPCFIAAVPESKGISAEGADNWIERYGYIRSKHGFPVSDTVVTSLGAPDHATNTAKLLGVDTRVLSTLHTFKPNTYKNVYLIGFYTQSNADDPQLALRQHVGVFHEAGDLQKPMVSGKRIIHWVGTDIFMLQHKTSWMGVQFITKMLSESDLGIIHLTECQQTHDELLELGIESQIVPLPSKILYDVIELPKKFTVGIYVNPTQDMYFEDTMYELADAMPDIDFKFFGDRYPKKDGNKEWVGYVNMATFLPTISALIRCTRHDGLPLSPIEAMMAGRQVIATHPLKYAVKHDLKNGEVDIATLITQIRELQKTTLDPRASQYWREVMDYTKFKKTIEKILK